MENSRIIKFRAWESEYEGKMHYSDKEHAKWHDENGKANWTIGKDGVYIELWNYDNWSDPDGDNMHIVKPEQVIMQYTGFKDSKNREIYEGDIIKEADFNPEGYTGEPIIGAKYIVEWGRGSNDSNCAGYEYQGFICKSLGVENNEDNEAYDGNGCILFKENIEVIGNIYENENLLEEN